MDLSQHPKRSMSAAVLLPEKGDSVPIMQGWIKKRTNAFFSKWPTRYFILENFSLYCYTSLSQERFLGGINFNKISITLTAFPKSRELHLDPLSARGSVRLRFNTSIEFEKWEEGLRAHISYSRGKKKALVDYPLWTLSRISVDEFKLLADSGDLMLFKSKNIASSVQRVFSSSEFDHVAIIYKYPSGDLAFLESTKDKGVELCYWDDFLAYAWGQSYSKLVYRKLNVVNRQEVCQKLDKFIKKVLGKKFGIGPKKLISRFISTPSEDESYFCSELVAKAYQEIGVLSTQRPASSVWPGDFSEKKKLPFQCSSLLLEQILDFRIIQSVLIK